MAWVLRPGRWVSDQVVTTWNRYIYLVDLRQENEFLRRRLDDFSLELAGLREQAAEALRLRRLLDFPPPVRWTTSGARVIAQRLGPNAVLDTVMVDKGTSSGIAVNTPVATPEGLVGRVLRAGFTSSNLLLLTDQNSKIPVLGETNRTTGILTGRGPGDLEVRYVPLNAPIALGELLLTSGLASIYPKGLPVARVSSIERSEISLFLTVRATPLVDLRDLEEVLLLHRTHDAPGAPAMEAAPPETPGG
ncbi:rod shape-determining protein MreC [Desulfocurvus sp. DL9XJH121]